MIDRQQSREQEACRWHVSVVSTLTHGHKWFMHARVSLHEKNKRCFNPLMTNTA